MGKQLEIGKDSLRQIMRETHKFIRNETLGDFPACGKAALFLHERLASQLPRPSGRIMETSNLLLQRKAEYLSAWGKILVESPTEAVFYSARFGQAAKTLLKIAKEDLNHIYFIPLLFVKPASEFILTTAIRWVDGHFHDLNYIASVGSNRLNYIGAKTEGG